MFSHPSLTFRDGSSIEPTPPSAALNLKSSFKVILKNKNRVVDPDPVGFGSEIIFPDTLFYKIIWKKYPENNEKF